MPLITLTQTDNVKWEKADLVPHLKQDEVQVWRVLVPPAGAQIENYRSVMSVAEIDRASRFVHPEDTNRYVTAHGVLRQLLSAHTAVARHQLLFTKNEFGKPALIMSDSKAALHFNLSHSGQYVIIALSKHPIGADVEYLKPDFNFHSLLPHYFTAAETHFITTTSASPLTAFFSAWTRKEALGKGLGSGITENMQVLPSLNGIHSSTGLLVVNDWNVQTFRVDDVHMASVACSGNVREVRFFNFIH
ncbi:4'-phosphopantetheinyl transferase superfamily protein [Mucilaginibacter sp. CSA2-8R]|uniref:4'-phosphopantetheinyl transferase family protein n=1 Tax=Mucilaginibacter sp. CSA2-8R TaxID=3141542 RepID=UPI00315D9F56